MHEPLGLRAPGDEARFLAEAEDPVLGLYEDDDGLAVAFDALHDGEVAAALVGRRVRASRSTPRLVRLIRVDDEATVVAADDRLTFTVFNDVGTGRRGRASRRWWPSTRWASTTSPPR